MIGAIEISSEVHIETRQYYNDLNYTGKQMPTIKDSQLKSRLLLLVSALHIGLGADTLRAIETIQTPLWGNQNSLVNQYSGQSQKDNTGLNFTGIKTKISNEILNDSVQITFGLNAEDIGFGLNVTNWNLAVEVWKSEQDFLLRNNGLSLELKLTDLQNLDGSSVETFQDGNNIVFTSPVDYGNSIQGCKNYVFTTFLSGQNLIEFKKNLVVGQEIFIGISNESSVNNGSHYTILSNRIINNSITSFSNLPGQAFPVPGYGAAFDVKGIVTSDLPPPINDIILNLAVNSEQAILNFQTENNGKAYKILKSIDLINWDECFETIGDGTIKEYRESKVARCYYKATRSN